MLQLLFSTYSLIPITDQSIFILAAYLEDQAQRFKAIWHSWLAVATSMGGSDVIKHHIHEPQVLSWKK